MVRDLLILAAVSMVLSVFVWSVFGNSPPRPAQPRVGAVFSLNAAPQPAPEFSPYMRTER
ncbi:hypothetical protein M2171_005187 [Bradyrhizobium japonicum USDA 38]|nr:hypothetical protein [Bradyrhizobium japonicum USDA 38]MCS3948568.1 hypothetical protein [Bradyrhizobium japonicum]